MDEIKKRSFLSKDIAFNGAAQNTIIKLFNESPEKLLSNYEIRLSIARERLENFISVHQSPDITSESTETSMSNTIEWNLEGLRTLSGFGRGDQILRVLMSLDAVNNNLQEKNILVVGPRTEDEILCLIGYGFNKNNVYGLDLISYSPYVDLGNMHEMPYPDAFFDIVFFSNVMSYSKTPNLAALEGLRVCKPGGIIAENDGLDKTPKEEGQVYFRKLFGAYSENITYETPEQILSLYYPHVDHVYFNHRVPSYLNVGNVAVVFQRD